MITIRMTRLPQAPEYLPAGADEAHAVLDRLGAPRMLAGRTLAISERVAYQKGRAESWARVLAATRTIKTTRRAKGLRCIF